ncbi:MAG TPA: glycosyltransferase family 87 protein [Gemmatimonadaceae bacterium]|nr:glycosyltransferase family 87 protein [Gemmatimonadaceae bacterium]
MMLLQAVPQFGPATLRGSLLMWWLPFLLTALLLIGYNLRAGAAPWIRRAFLGVVALSIAGFGGLVVARAAHNVIAPPEWDIQAFWIYARVAVDGGNFYEPADIHRVAAPLQHEAIPLSSSPVFTREALDAGFLYPPPTMLLVGPIGFLSLRAASFAWYLLLGTALVACILALRRTFFPDGGWVELATVTALVLLFRPTYLTFAFGQTSFLTLLALIAFWRTRDRPLSGVFLALGMFVKPIIAFFVLYPLLRRNWRALASAAATSGVLSVIAVLLFGPQVCLTYFTSNPIERAPTWLYTLHENQSLLSAMLRLAHYDGVHGAPLLYPPFLIAAALIVGLTMWAALRLPRDRGELALALMVPAALLIYPQSLDHYAMLLLVPLFYLWTQRAQLGLTTGFTIALLTVEYGIIRYNLGAIETLATGLLWLFLLALALRPVRIRAAEPLLQPTLG